MEKHRNRDEVFYQLANIFMWVQKVPKKKGITALNSAPKAFVMSGYQIKQFNRLI